MTSSPSVRGRGHDLLLGEWACLGAVYPGPIHGFAVAALMKPDADIGRVWSMSRALTYRALDQLTERGLVVPARIERGAAGGARVVLAATASGRDRLREWVTTPVEHLRDVRAELLLKLVTADRCGLPTDELLARQRVLSSGRAESLSSAGDDVVALWRAESSQAVVRFLEQLEHRRTMVHR